MTTDQNKKPCTYINDILLEAQPEVIQKIGLIEVHQRTWQENAEKKSEGLTKKIMWTGFCNE